MTLILEDPAFAAVGNLQVEIAAIGVTAFLANASHEGGGKFVPSAYNYPKPYPSLRRWTLGMLGAVVRGVQDRKLKRLKHSGAT